MCVENQGSQGDLRSVLCGCRPIAVHLCALAFLRELQQLEPDLSDARVNQSNLPGDTIGYINFSALLIGTTIIDAHNFELAISGIHDANYGPERKNGVCRCERLGIEVLAVGGLLAVEFRPIPAGVADPSFDRFGRAAAVSHQGCLHRRSDEEHKGYPSECSPDKE